MIEKKLKICSVCEKPSILWKSSPKMCRECAVRSVHKSDEYKAKHPKQTFAEAISTPQIKKVSDKKKLEIKESGNYYKKAIGQNIIDNNGKCLCENCKQQIKVPTGRNCCHIIGKGADLTLYYHPLNNFILGKGEVFNECSCGWLFDESGKKDTLNIYAEYLHRKELLNDK